MAAGCLQAAARAFIFKHADLSECPARYCCTEVSKPSSHVHNHYARLHGKHAQTRRHAPHADKACRHTCEGIVGKAEAQKSRKPRPAGGQGACRAEDSEQCGPRMLECPEATAFLQPLFQKSAAAMVTCTLQQIGTETQGLQALHSGPSWAECACKITHGCEQLL